MCELFNTVTEVMAILLSCLMSMVGVPYEEENIPMSVSFPWPLVLLMCLKVFTTPVTGTNCCLLSRLIC